MFRVFEVLVTPKADILLVVQRTVEIEVPSEPHLQVPHEPLAVLVTRCAHDRCQHVPKTNS